MVDIAQVQEITQQVADSGGMESGSDPAGSEILHAKDGAELPDIVGMNSSVDAHTSGQIEALLAIREFLHDSGRREFVLAGFAGTGKTTIVENIYRYVYGFAKYPAIMSITNKAIQVLRDKLPFISEDCFGTIHSALYGAPDDKMRFSIGSPKVQPKRLTIIDEASMIPDDILADVRRACRYGKIIFIGDGYQLRPVGDDQNMLDNPDVQLTEVVRHDNGILTLATAIRNKKKVIVPGGKMDGIVRCRKDPVDTFLVNRKSTDSIVVLVPTNKVRVNYNLRIRDAWFGMHGQMRDIVSGDSLISISNNNYLSNGATFSVAEILLDEGVKQTTLLAGGKEVVEDYHRYRIRDDEGRDFRVFLFPITKLPSIYNQQVEELKVRDEQGNVCDVNKSVVLATYGYAISCHKAQGGQWERVIVDHTWFKKDPRWLYTAVTRARERLYLHMAPYKNVSKMKVEKIQVLAEGDYSA